MQPTQTPALEKQKLPTHAATTPCASIPPLPSLLARSSANACALCLSMRSRLQRARPPRPCPWPCCIRRMLHGVRRAYERSYERQWRPAGAAGAAGAARATCATRGTRTLVGGAAAASTVAAARAPFGPSSLVGGGGGSSSGSGGALLPSGVARILTTSLRTPFARWRRGLVRLRLIHAARNELSGKVFAFSKMARGRSSAQARLHGGVRGMWQRWAACAITRTCLLAAECAWQRTALSRAVRALSAALARHLTLLAAAAHAEWRAIRRTWQRLHASRRRGATCNMLLSAASAAWRRRALPSAIAAWRAPRRSSNKTRTCPQGRSRSRAPRIVCGSPPAPTLAPFL